jgi:peptidoglycan-N-acetylglucosamine deacetylase
MYLKKTPIIVQRYLSRYRWRFDTPEPVLYLTFDDGPTPQITEWVMDQLAAYRARATFFLVGNNVAANPELVHELIDNGHAIGNHTQTHRDGYKTSLRAYLRDFLRCQQTIFEYTGHQARLFRPPYGRLTQTKARYIARTHEIIMMDVIAGDFDPQLRAEDCIQHITQHARPGSIILLHDSVKAWPRLSQTLPTILKHFSERGFRFEAISNREPRRLLLPSNGHAE